MATYCFSDLHGYLDLYKKIKEYVKPEDTLYCLGDCGDRGPESWETVKAVATDTQITYLKGNHEDMLVKAAREALNPNDWDWGCEKQRLLACNGGMDTLDGLLQENNPEVWINHLAKLPIYTYYTNTQGQKIFLCHAGASLWADDPDMLPTEKELMWNRLHYFDNCRLLDSTVVVHGHTPIMYLAEDIGVEEPDEWIALKYADGKKYCIDQGTVLSGHSILFNLDTFESIDINLND